MTHDKPTDERSVAQKIHAILSLQVQCVLATQHADNLYQHLMAYAMAESLATIYLASFRQTQKVNNMQRNPNVSLLWDNRTGNNTDHTDGFALAAQGCAKIMNTSAQGQVRQQVLSRNDSLAGLLNQENAVLISIDIQSYHLAIGYSKSLFFRP
jgi:general stress protein 26